MPNCNFINESEVPTPAGECNLYETLPDDETRDGWPSESTERKQYFEDTSDGHRGWVTDRNDKILSFYEFATIHPGQSPKDRCLKAWRRDA